MSRTGAVAALLLLAALAVTLAFHGLLRGRVVVPYLLVLSAWLAYFVAHHVERGRFVDPPEGTAPARADMVRAAPALIAVAAGVVLFAAGLRSALPVAWIGGSLVLLGYAAAHRRVTGDLL